MHLPIRFGRYILTGKLAAGGMAEIYRAKHLGEGGFEKTVAIKKLLPAWSSNHDFITMLIDEAKVLVHLQHPNIVQVIELGKEGESYFLSMELVEGLDLGRLFSKIVRDSISLPQKFSIYIICQILNALDFAHKKSLDIVHRDISPPNVLISWNGEVKVADFGIAKGAHRTYETAVTQVKGKYSYMSPEQASGGMVDKRTDIYATGILLYELLTLKRLYDAPNDLEVIELVKESNLPLEPLEKLEPALKKIIVRALEKDVHKRYQTASEFLADLNDYTLKSLQMTSAFEFTQFLNKNFEKSEVKDDPALVEDAPQKTLPMRPPSKKRKTFLPMLVALGIIITVLVLIIYPKEKTTMVANTTSNEISPPILQEPPVLNIQAKPWGIATVQDYVQNKETPIRNLKLKEGMHTVKVYYEPTNQRLEGKIDAKNGDTINCLAIFGSKPSLKCGPRQ